MMTCMFLNPDATGSATYGRQHARPHSIQAFFDSFGGLANAAVRLSGAESVGRRATGDVDGAGVSGNPSTPGQRR